MQGALGDCQWCFFLAPLFRMIASCFSGRLPPPLSLSLSRALRGVQVYEPTTMSLQAWRDAENAQHWLGPEHRPPFGGLMTDDVNTLASGRPGP